ncbi:MAG: helix-turn-helix domain-containing protein [Deltaproteobacteria bacterium]|nr:helix-turn-helix domain-containing protein [Deltaproteobacteria bacterium]
MGVTEDTVRRWRGRWADEPKTTSLHDRHRSGRPPSVTPTRRATLISLACQRPEDEGRRPLRDIWPLASIRCHRLIIRPLECAA